MLKRSLLTLLLISFSNLAWTEMAPKLAVHDADGKRIELPRQHEGADIYLFWASWCGICKIVMPEINKVSSDYDDVTVFAFQIRDEDMDDPEAFINQLGYNFEVLPAADEAMEPFGVKGTKAEQKQRQKQKKQRWQKQSKSRDTHDSDFFLQTLTTNSNFTTCLIHLTLFHANCQKTTGVNRKHTLLPLHFQMRAPSIFMRT